MEASPAGPISIAMDVPSSGDSAPGESAQITREGEPPTHLRTLFWRGPGDNAGQEGDACPTE
jgi:hypothetical protein